MNCRSIYFITEWRRRGRKARPYNDWRRSLRIKTMCLLSSGHTSSSRRQLNSWQSYIRNMCFLNLSHQHSNQQWLSSYFPPSPISITQLDPTPFLQALCPSLYHCFALQITSTASIKICKLFLWVSTLTLSLPEGNTKLFISFRTQTEIAKAIWPNCKITDWGRKRLRKPRDIYQ